MRYETKETKSNKGMMTTRPFCSLDIGSDINIDINTNTSTVDMPDG